MCDTAHYAELCEQMVSEQLEARGIRDPRVLKAMLQVPREAFVPAEFRAEAYADRALPIDCEQTISQPLIVAMMTEALQLNGSERVLEIGTGSGYQAAVLSRVAREVISIERHEQLAKAATTLLRRLGYDNVTTICGDGTLGCPSPPSFDCPAPFDPTAPFDRIIVTAATASIPPALIDQLTDDGRLVIPLGDSQAPDAATQMLTLLQKRGDKLHRRELTGCRFVPLISNENEQES